MRIGLSLPSEYLVGNPRTSAAAVWQEAFGRTDVYLEALNTAGVTSVELRSIAEDAHPELALHAAQCVWRAGMRLTVHGRLPRSISGKTLDQVYPALVPLAKALRARDRQSILTLHCYADQKEDEQSLAGRTVQALRKLLDVFQRDDVPLRIALEINHISTRHDPGVTYEGILDMIAKVDHPRIGACWDFGHAFMNVQQGLLERVPDDDFLKRVIHTHVHDLGPRTHFPLTRGVVPLDLYLDLLFNRGYAGVINLEVSPERFRGSAREGVWASVERLAEYGRRRVRFETRVTLDDIV